MAWLMPGFRSKASASCLSGWKLSILGKPVWPFPLDGQINDAQVAACTHVERGFAEEEKWLGYTVHVYTFMFFKSAGETFNLSRFL